MARVPSYNFDTPTSSEISYEIDVTQAPGQRIRKLALRGVPVTPEQEFIVATNNYRASGGGNFPGLDGSKTILASPDTSRDVLIAYIRDVKKLTRATDGALRSWQFHEGQDGGAGGIPFGAGHAGPGAGGGAGQRQAGGGRRWPRQGLRAVRAGPGEMKTLVLLLALCSAAAPRRRSRATRAPPTRLG